MDYNRLYIDKKMKFYKDIYEVDTIVNIKKTKLPNGKIGHLFRVRWKGYTAKDDTMEPLENLASSRVNFLQAMSFMGKKSSISGHRRQIRRLFNKYH